MFNIFKPKPKGETITLKLNGLHCVSCGVNIDVELEDLPGVTSAKTSYAKQESVIVYDPKLTDPSQFHVIIQKLGYKIAQ